MASIDSDSSDNETESFQTTNTLLGYASKEPTDDPFSQLGGHPVSTQNTSTLTQAYLIQTDMARCCKPTFGTACKMQSLQSHDVYAVAAQWRPP